MAKEKITGYQERKKAGLCVRSGCEIKPEKKEDGSRRSYCPKHNAQNKRNSEAWAARHGKSKVRKTKKVSATSACSRIANLKTGGSLTPAAPRITAGRGCHPGSNHRRHGATWLLAQNRDPVSASSREDHARAGHHGGAMNIRELISQLQAMRKAR